MEEGINSILDKANSPGIGQKGQDLQEMVSESRSLALAKYYPQQLPEGKRGEWNTADPFKQVEIMRENGYKLNEKLSRQFVNDYSSKIVKALDIGIDGMYDDAFKKSMDANATPELRQDANKRLALINNMVNATLGFDADRLVSLGPTQGFSNQVWQQNTQRIGPSLAQLEQDSLLKQIDEDKLKGYMDQIKHQFPKFNDKLAAQQGPEAMRQIASVYRQAQQSGNYSGFERSLPGYFEPKY